MHVCDSSSGVTAAGFAVALSRAPRNGGHLGALSISIILDNNCSGLRMSASVVIVFTQDLGTELLIKLRRKE